MISKVIHVVKSASAGWLLLEASLIINKTKKMESPDSTGEFESHVLGRRIPSDGISLGEARY